MREILKKNHYFWSLVNKKELTTIKESRDYLLELSSNLKKINADFSLKYELLNSIVDNLTILSKAPESKDGLMITSLIVLEKEEVGYILDKTKIREFSISNDWFFSTYRNAEIIAESEFYIYLKTKRIDNLAFVSEIILNKKKEVIFQKEPTDNSFIMSFWNSIKE